METLETITTITTSIGALTFFNSRTKPRLRLPAPMFSLREKLLVLPWQQRKYDNHRRKVQSALPAIDNRQPLSRAHVALKLKKKQHEEERVAKIERENLILLKRLRHIMKTNKVDNYRDAEPPPQFLSQTRRSKTRGGFKAKVPSEQEDLERDLMRLRESKCLACNPRKTSALTSPSVCEERVPWEPPPPPVGLRSRSVPIPSRLEVVPEKRPAAVLVRPKTEVRTTRGRVGADCNRSPQKIVLTRGSLKLSVNFPSDTNVKLQQGALERVIMSGRCYCKNYSQSKDIFVI